jgi:hypothetical protein
VRSAHLSQAYFTQQSNRSSSFRFCTISKGIIVRIHTSSISSPWGRLPVHKLEFDGRQSGFPFPMCCGPTEELSQAGFEPLFQFSSFPFLSFPYAHYDLQCCHYFAGNLSVTSFLPLNHSYKCGVVLPCKSPSAKTHTQVLFSRSLI